MPLALLAFVSVVRPTLAAELPGPTFHWSFDRGMEVEVCAEGAEAQVDGTPQFVESRQGQALLVPDRCTIAFPTEGHINPREGTVALWVKPMPPEGRPKYARLFDLTGTAEPRTSLRLVHPSHTILYGEMSVGGTKYIPWPMGDASVRDEEWQHLAITWGPAGGTFYVNGVTLTSTAEMPELADLPERFYVGSEAEGHFSACAPIDELFIFDRALRSHELFALAGRGSPTDLEAANWLRNSSFELGPRPWQSFSWAAKSSTTSIDAEFAHTGRHSFLMDRSGEDHDWWSTVWLIGPWLHLQRGETVTLSAWVRADRPDVQVRLDIQRGTEGRAVTGVPQEAELGQFYQVGADWQRLVLTGALPISYKDGYRPRMSLVTKPCKLWIDDVQMALGPERPYAPAASVEIGLSAEEDRAAYDRGEAGRAVLHAYNATDQPQQATVRLAERGPDGSGFLAEDATLTVPAHDGIARPVGPIVFWQPGHYTVTAETAGQQAELTFAAFRDHRKTPSPKGSPFGAHGGADEVARGVGLSQYRDVSGLTWRWIERAAGAWRYDDREAAYSRHVANGFTCCATLADAPEWAALPGGQHVPADVEEWRRYVRTVITDFAPYVDIWEVWNEPDLKPTFVEDPAKYVELLRAAREIQRQADPESQLAGLCAAGVTDRAIGWMEEAIELGALELMDLLAWHPYYHERPEDGYYEALRRVNELMEQHGGRKPMIFTEFGTAGVSDWSLHIPWTADGWRKYDEREQAAMLVRQCVIGLGEGATKLYWYKWKEERIQTGPDTFGLVRADTYATPKLAAIAYNQMIWQLEAAALPPERDAMPAQTQWAYTFGTPAGKITVAWDAEGESSLAWPADGRVFDLWGGELPRQKRLRLSGAPVYIARG